MYRRKEVRKDGGREGKDGRRERRNDRRRGVYGKRDRM